MGLSDSSSVFRMGAFVLFTLLVLPSTSAEVFEYRKEDLPPVILIPGLAGSNLDGRFINVPKICHSYANDWFLLYMNDVLYVLDFDCLLACLSMTYDNQTGLSYSNPEVQIRPSSWGTLDGINNIDNGEHVTYMSHLGKTLKKVGFEEKINLFGAPYDFRFGPHQQEAFFTNLTKLIEKTVEDRKSPAVLVAHSMGAPLVSILLNRKSEEWRKKHVSSLVTLSGAWGGAVSSFEALATGPKDYSFLRPQVILEQSVMYMMPDLDLWDEHDTIVEIGDNSYSMKDIEYLLERMKLTDNADMYRKQERFHHKAKMAPQVPLHCLYGDKLDTLEIIHYNNSMDYPSIIERKHYGNGDGTVNHKSLDLCSQFTKYQSDPVYVKSFEGVSHVEIVKDEGTINYLIQHILGIASEKTKSPLKLGKEGELKISSEEITNAIIESNKKYDAYLKQREANRELLKNVFEENKMKSDGNSHLQMRQRIEEQFLRKFSGRKTSLHNLPLKELNRL